MSRYFYRGRNSQGQIVEGLCRAESLPDARRQLDKLGYQIALLRPSEEKPVERRAPAPPPRATAPPPSGRPTPRVGPDWRRAKPILWGAFVTGLLWLSWDLSSGSAPPARPTVAQQRLVVDANWPGVSPAPGERLEFVFPDVPYTVEKSAAEALTSGRLHLELELRSARKPTYCLVRCRSARVERRIELR